MVVTSKTLSLAAIVVAAISGILLFRAHEVEMGIAALKSEDYSRALSPMKIAATMGDATAESLLGDMYALGWGVSKDDEEAIRWYRRAGVEKVEGQDPAAPAMFYVGIKYSGGQGVQRNEPEARKWLERSAKAGYPQAIKALARMRQRDQMMRGEGRQ